jgi:8-oxo-dGTP pyrophosphatase MutT (NUDIX family)
LPDHRIELLRQRLALHLPTQILPAAGTVRASVALLVRPGDTDLELLLIKRTEFVGDPWSGHMAFPGGRFEPQDADGVATAVRETREEVGVDVQSTGALIGALDPTQPRAGVSLIVFPYVFAVPPETTATPNCEVQLTVWIPLRTLLRPEATIEYMHHNGDGQPLRFPAFGYRGHTIWGLTHRILSQFLSLAEPQLPPGGSA